MKNARLIGSTALIVSTALASCSSDSDDSSSNSNVSKVGVVQITDPLQGESLDFTGFFFEFQQPGLVSEFLEEMNPTVQQDTCTLVFEDNEFDIDPEFSTALNAGETLTLSSPAGTFAELQRVSFEEIEVYFGPDELPAPVPSGLVVDIPGADFPAFANVSIPDVEPFVLTTELVGPFADEIDVTSEMTWEAGSDPDALINWYYLAVESTTNELGVEEIREIDLDCLLVDDGSFTLDAEMQTQLIEAGFDTVGVNIGRRAVKSVKQGDAMLILQNVSGDL